MRYAQVRHRSVVSLYRSPTLSLQIIRHLDVPELFLTMAVCTAPSPETVASLCTFSSEFPNDQTLTSFRPSVPAGTYILSVSAHDHLFEQVRLSIFLHAELVFMQCCLPVPSRCIRHEFYSRS
jgi:hypothetical protein